MKDHPILSRLLPWVSCLAMGLPLAAQNEPAPGAAPQPPQGERPQGRDFEGPPDFGPGGPGGGPGGPGRMQDREILKQFDKNNNKVLDTEERKEARAFLAKEGNQGRGFG